MSYYVQRLEDPQHIDDDREFYNEVLPHSFSMDNDGGMMMMIPPSSTRAVSIPGNNMMKSTATMTTNHSSSSNLYTASSCAESEISFGTEFDQVFDMEIGTVATGKSWDDMRQLLFIPSSTTNISNGGTPEYNIRRTGSVSSNTTSSKGRTRLYSNSDSDVDYYYQQQQPSFEEYSTEQETEERFVKHLSTYQQRKYGRSNSGGGMYSTPLGSLMENCSADDLQEQENSTDDGSFSSARTDESSRKKPSLLYENKGLLPPRPPLATTASSATVAPTPAPPLSNNSKWNNNNHMLNHRKVFIGGTPPPPPPPPPPPHQSLVERHSISIKQSTKDDDNETAMTSVMTYSTMSYPSTTIKSITSKDSDVFDGIDKNSPMNNSANNHNFSFGSRIPAATARYESGNSTEQQRRGRKTSPLKVYDVIDPYNSSSDAVELTFQDTEDPDSDELQGCRLVSQVDYFGSQYEEEEEEVNEDGEGEEENSGDSESFSDDSDISSEESDDEQRLRLDGGAETLSLILEPYLESDSPYRLWEKLDMWDVIEKYIPEQDIYGIKAPSGSMDDQNDHEHADVVSLRIADDIRDEILQERAQERDERIGIPTTENISGLNLMTEICVSEDENDFWDDGSSLGQSSFAGTPMGFGCLIDYDFAMCETPMSKTSICAMSCPTILQLTGERKKNRFDRGIPSDFSVSTCGRKREACSLDEVASVVDGRPIFSIPTNEILQSIDAVIAFHKNDETSSDSDADEDSIDWMLLQSAVEMATINLNAHELILSKVPVLQGIGLSLLLNATTPRN
jgi:hypothetical protein